MQGGSVRGVWGCSGAGSVRCVAVAVMTWVAEMTRGRVVTVISIVCGAVCGEEGTISIRGSRKIQAPFLDVTVSRCPALTVDWKYSPERPEYSVYTVYLAHPLPKYNVYTKDLYCPKSDPNTVYIQCFQPSPKYSKYVFPIYM